MNAHAEVASHVIYGWDPIWVSSILFVLTYAVIVSERVNRAIVSLVGAGLMISLGVLNQETAVRGVDFNTLGLLTGMMVIVAITRRSGVFQFIAIWSAKRVLARPWALLVMLSVVTAVFSALLDNVTTVLLIAPVTLLITDELEVSPYPFLVAEIFASNIGGAATLIGDPPNIMIGSAVRLTFNDFLLNLAPITPLILAATLAVFYFVYGRAMGASDERRDHVMRFREREAITDVPLLKKSLTVLGVVIVAFVFAHPLRLEPATIAMFGAALLLLVTNVGASAEAQSENVHRRFGEVEWVTIFFFVGLFIVVHGIEHAGVLAILAERVLETTGGDLVRHRAGDPVDLRRRLRGGRQHPVRRDDDSADQVHGPQFRRGRGADAPVVVARARRVSGRERIAGRCEREPDRGRHGGAGRTPDPLPAVHDARVPDDADEHRDRERLRLAPVPLENCGRSSRGDTATMLPDDLLIVTRVAPVRACWSATCSANASAARVQSLPYRDASGRITGRVTLKCVANRSIVPEYVAQLALVVGDRLSTFG